MKYQTLMFLLVSFCVACSKDSQISTKQSEEFLKFFGTIGMDTSGQVIAVGDGYLLSASEAFDTEHRACLYKTDLNGNLQWRLAISDSLNLTARSFIAAQDGGYYLCGYLTDKSGYSDVFVSKVDANNSVDWVKSYTAPYDQYANCITYDANGDLYLSGVSYSDASRNESNQDILLMKLSASGDSLWTKYYGGTKADVANGIAMGSDGTVNIIGSSMSYKENNQDKSNIILLVTNPAGYLLHRITYGGMGNDYGYGICRSADGLLFLAGEVENDNGDSDGWLACISGNIYTPIWTKTAGRGRDDAFMSVACSGMELYSAGFTKNEQNGNKELYIAKYSTEGKFLKEFISGGEGDESATSACFASDGRPVITGTSRLESNTILFILKTKL